MDNCWQGRYENLVSSLVRFGNVASRNNSLKKHYKKYGIDMSAQEWQVLSYIQEHPSQNWSMACIADALGIATSTMTKYTDSLVKAGLVKKCRQESNKKNIILKATPEGIDFYKDQLQNRVSGRFNTFFELLSLVPDHELQLFSQAVDALAGKLPVSRSQENIDP